MKKYLIRGTAGLLATVMMISGISTTVLAAEPTKEGTTEAIVTAIVSETLNKNINEETARQIAKEIINGKYDYSGVSQSERSALSSSIKTVLKFIKNNWSKIAPILKKYGIKAAQGKGVVQFIDNLLNGVIEVSNSIDNAIYTVVDFIAPGLDSNVKQIITNAIRLISPV